MRSHARKKENLVLLMHYEADQWTYAVFPSICVRLDSKNQTNTSSADSSTSRTSLYFDILFGTCQNYCIVGVKETTLLKKMNIIHAIQMALLHERNFTIAWNRSINAMITDISASKAFKRPSLCGLGSLMFISISPVKKKKSISQWKMGVSHFHHAMDKEAP